MEEQWLPVKGYEQFYEVSDHGRVRSFPRPVNGGVRRPKMLSPMKNGHWRVSLRRNGKSRMFMVHHLVLQAFVGPRPSGMLGCHYDDDPTNNHLSNLRWDTPEANATDRARNGHTRSRSPADQTVIEGERWLPVVGFEGFYEVSDHARVRGRHGRILRGQTRDDKYWFIQLQADGRKRTTGINALMLEAFVGSRPHGMVACHNDGNPTNNRLNNLRWDTPAGNNRDTVKHGTHHNAQKTHCIHGHLLDEDRTCHECARIRQYDRYMAQETCPQGHPFDGVKYHTDGSVFQRFCTICVSDQLTRGRVTRGRKSNCGRCGTELVPVYRSDGTFKQNDCPVCSATNRRARAQRRSEKRRAAAAKATPPSLDGERWRWMPDYEGLYQVSNLGRVWALPREVHRKNGVVALVREHIMRPSLVQGRYPIVGLTGLDGAVRFFYVSKLREQEECDA